MRTFALAIFIFIASLSVPFPASALSCQPGYIERDDGSGCDLIQPSGTSGSAGSPGSSSGLTSPGSAGSPGNSAGSGQNIKLINPLNTGECAPNGNCLLNFLNKILDFVIKIGAVVVVLMMVYVGYLFVVAQGKEDKIREARQALLWTVVGALILLGSQAIAKGIEATVKAISAGN